MTTLRRRDVLKATGGAAVLGTVATTPATASNHENDENDENDESEEDEEGETARVRVAHLSPDAPNVDVLVDGEAVLEDVSFRSVSEYLALPAGSYAVTITAAGDRSTVAFEGDVTLEARAYTLAAIGELTPDHPTFDVLVLEDDLSAPEEGTARVRIVHASPDAGRVDVTTASGATLFDSPGFGESASVEVPAGSYDLQVRDDVDDETGTVLGTFPVDLEAGGVYTAFAAGYRTPDDEPAHEPFDLLLALDAGPETEETAHVRVAHLSPDAPNVDVLVDGEAVLEDVPFRTVSDYLELPPGTYAVAITAAGDPSTVAFEGELALEATTYTVAAIGELTVEHPTFRPLVLEDDVDADEGVAGVRLLHASPDAGRVDVTTVSGATLFDSPGFGETASVEVPAGSYDLQVRDDVDDETGTVLGTFPVALDGGTTYTAVAAGYRTPDDEPAHEPFDLLLVENAKPDEEDEEDDEDGKRDEDEGDGRDGEDGEDEDEDDEDGEEGEDEDEGGDDGEDEEEEEDEEGEGEERDDAH